MSSKKIPLLIFQVMFLLYSAVDAYPYRVGNTEVKVEGSLSEVYDDNVTYARSGKIEDLITRLSLDLGAKWTGPDQVLEFKGNVKHGFYSRHHLFNNTAEDAMFRFDKELLRHDRLHFKNTFTYSKELRSFEESLGRTVGHYAHYNNDMESSYNKDISDKLNVTVKFDNETYNVTRKDLQDSVLYRPGLEAKYHLGSETTLSPLYEYYRRELVHSDVSADSHASAHAVAMGLKQEIAAEFFFDAKVGADFIKDYFDRSYTKPRFNASFQGELDQKTKAVVSFEKKYYANSYFMGILNSWRSSFTLSRQWQDRWTCEFKGSYSKGRYGSAVLHISESGIIEIIDLVDTVCGGEAILTYEFNQSLKAKFSYAYAHRGSNISDRSYSKNTIFLGLTRTF